MLNEEQVENYLCRIGLCELENAGLPAADAASLALLHQRHLLGVPFDNLDILAHLPLITTTEGLFAKIVEQCRGGICYELNFLFGELLRALGFTVNLVAARVPARVGACDPGPKPDFAHLLLLVSAETERQEGLRSHSEAEGCSGAGGAKTIWLADVGFGRGCFFEPLRFEPGLTQEDHRGFYRIEPSRDAEAAGCYDLFFTDGSRGASQESLVYRFNPQPRGFSEFFERWQWTATSRDSIFLSGSLVAQDTLKGRISLSEHYLRITTQDEQEVIPVADKAQFSTLLSTYFGIRDPR